MARSHIKLWWGDLVISDRASRHAEERNGEVSAFVIGDTCLAWWSNAQLRHLAERRHRERRDREEERRRRWSDLE